MTEFVLASVPMFILMASILERSGVAQDLFNAVHVWAGGVPGGVGVATMLMAVLIGATIGVIGGEVTLLGIVALPQLFRLGYDRKLSIGMICAGGALGSMIPPSIILVFFGLAGERADRRPAARLGGARACAGRPLLASTSSSAASSTRGWGRSPTGAGADAAAPARS